MAHEYESGERGCFLAGCVMVVAMALVVFGIIKLAEAIF